MDSLKFGLNVESNVSDQAARDAATLRKMADALRDAKSELGHYTSQLAKAKELGDIAGKARYESLVRGARDKAYALGSMLDETGGRVPGAPKPSGGRGDGMRHFVDPSAVARSALRDTSRGVRELGAAFASGDLRGMVHGTTEAMAGMASTLDLLVPGLGEVAGGAVKVAGAFGEIAMQAVETGFRVIDFNRQLRATFDALGTGGPNAGDRMLDVVNRLAERLPQSREEIARWAKGFAAEGITDVGQLRAQVLATASAHAIMGDEGVEAFEHLSRKIRLAAEAGTGLKVPERALDRLYRMGVNATDMAQALGMSTMQLESALKAGTVNAQKFGNALTETLIRKGKEPLDAMAQSWEGLRRKVSETVDHLFDGIDTKPLVSAIEQVIAVGQAGQPAGQAMKGGITAGVNGVIRVLGEMVIQGAVAFMKLEAHVIRFETRMRPLVRLVESAVHALRRFDGIGAKILPTVDKIVTVAEVLTGNPLALADAAGKFGWWATSASDSGKKAKQAADAKAATVGISAFRGAGEWSGPPPLGPDLVSVPRVRRAGASSVVDARRIDNSRRIDHLHVNIFAPDGVTDASTISQTALGAAFERTQLMSGY